MDKINPLLYITDTDPRQEAVVSASNWYNTETESLTLTENELAWMKAQGWETTSTHANTDGTTTYGLRRRILDPELALNSLISSFTAAYNDGRNLNDQRYDDIITLHSVMLDKAEDKLIAGDDDNTVYNDDVFNSLIETIIGNIETDQSSYETSVEGSLDNYGDSIRSQINTRFDNQLAGTKQDLINRGMYNSTVWDSISAGIERERSLALNDIEDKITQMQLNLEHRIYDTKVAMRQAFISARDRLRNVLFNSVDRKLTIRNAIIQALMNFMERRTDSYPDLGEIGQLTSKLGVGNTNTYSP